MMAPPENVFLGIGAFICSLLGGFGFACLAFGFSFSVFSRQIIADSWIKQGIKYRWSFLAQGAGLFFVYWFWISLVEVDMPHLVLAGAILGAAGLFRFLARSSRPQNLQQPEGD